MKKVFVDTNILLDVFLEREPFCAAAQMLWAAVLDNKIKAAVSAISMNNCFFIVKKLAGSDKAYQAIDTIQESFTVIDLDKNILNKARRARFIDFEDAVQYFSAKRFKAATLISRDPDGFEIDDIAVMDAAQFLAVNLN